MLSVLGLSKDEMGLRSMVDPSTHKSTHIYMYGMSVSSRMCLGGRVASGLLKKPS